MVSTRSSTKDKKWWFLKKSQITTYLTSTTDINDENLKIPGCIIYHVDHSSDAKRGGVCIY